MRWMSVAVQAWAEKRTSNLFPAFEFFDTFFDFHSVTSSIRNRPCLDQYPGSVFSSKAVLNDSVMFQYPTFRVVSIPDIIPVSRGRVYDINVKHEIEEDQQRQKRRCQTSFYLAPQTAESCNWMKDLLIIKSDYLNANLDWIVL
jgi:hypothetical protein